MRALVAAKFGDIRMLENRDKGEEIEQVRTQEQGLSSAAKREAAEKRRILKLFSEKALKAKKAKDARAYAELLRSLKIAEDSPEWKNAWKFFYSS
jgi:hypothetical protein